MSGKPPAALTVAGRPAQRAEVVLRGIRFECVTKGREQPVAAVVGHDLKRLDLEQCEFYLPEMPAAGSGQLSDIGDLFDATSCPVSI